MPDAPSGPLTVEIRPGMSILGVLQHLNYRAWYAMAEFVDNAVQSWLSDKDKLEALHGQAFQLRIEIEIEPGDDPRIIIRDNAAGIPSAQFPRAFRPAAVPPDRSGLSEFGMGMKSAACWFAKKWSVRTTAIGEPFEYTVDFDIEKIVNDDITELEIRSRPVAAEHHYTEITLSDLHQPLRGRTLGKVKDHLEGIYRNFLRFDQVEILFNGQPLVFEEPDVLEAPSWRDPNGPSERWFKRVDIPLGGSRRVSGFVAIREKGSTSLAGLALFRRDRLIVGSADEAWRPERIFGKPNSFEYQRIFGELVVSGFDVAHTKDGFRWNEWEDVLIEKLAEAIDASPLPIMSQARRYRANAPAKDIGPAAVAAVEQTAAVIEREVPELIRTELANDAPVDDAPAFLPPSTTPLLAADVVDVALDDQHWRVYLQLSNEPGVGEWASTFVADPTPSHPDVRHLGVRLSLAHPFTLAFSQPGNEHVQPMLRLAIAMLIAQETARDAGVKKANTFLRYVNKLLRGALADIR